MRVPVSWLEDFTELPSRLDELPERLTSAGLESALTRPVPFPERVVTGKILSCEKHPKADRLSVCGVDVGQGETHEIVCGAPNAEAGPVAVVALPGADLGGGFVIAERKLRGVTSHGMLCSEAELGLSEQSDGILLLPPDTPIGKPVSEVLRQEAVLETEPMSNRGDWMSIIGVAREVAALSGRALVDAGEESSSPSDGGWSVRIEDPRECPRYCGRIVEGLTAGPSPAWMAERLQAAGVRPIMNLVDVTNYVLLERGHPLHAFDLEKLAGREIGVRRSKAGEKLVTLDAKERDLGAGTLVITDASGPVATGGIMGGESTAVSERTQGVFLEGASFQASRVRAGARQLRLTTDASARFERGVDPESVPRALDRCVELLLELCPGAKLVHSVDEYPAPAIPSEIRLRKVKLSRLLGIEVPADEVRATLENLGLRIVEESSDSWTALAPTFRPDLTLEEDLVEEVARIHGYDRIPSRARLHAAANTVHAPRVDALQRSRRALLGLGLTEVITPSLVDGDAEARLAEDDTFFRTPVALRNPLTSDRDALRGSLTPSLLQVLVTNLARSTRDLAIFEAGRAFGRADQGGVDERTRVAILLSGTGLTASQVMSAKPCDFFDMKGLLEVYVEQFWGAKLRLEKTAPSPLDPVRSAEIIVRDRSAGFLGEVHREARAAFDLPPDLPVLLAELDLEAIVSPADRRVEFEPLPRFPGAVRDLAFVVPVSCRHADLESALAEAGGEFLEDHTIFDVYEGEPLDPGEKSLAYTLVFRSPERSLTNEEVDDQVDHISKHLGKKLGARIR